MAVWFQVEVRVRALTAQPVFLLLSVTQRHCSCSMRLVALRKCYMRLLLLPLARHSLKVSLVNELFFCRTSVNERYMMARGHSWSD